MLVKKALLIIAIWWGLSLESIASQEKITGSTLTKLIIDHLSEEGLSAQPIINKNRVRFSNFKFGECKVHNG